VTPSGGISHGEGVGMGSCGVMVAQKVVEQTDSCSCEKRQESDICLL